VVTSGSYEKYALLNGKRYAHIINPATGYPATGLTSVTVLGPSAEQANALSTSIMVLGHKKGRRLLRQFPDYQCLMMADNGKLYTSRNLPRKQVQLWRAAAP
jgi:thiamine biosynthesis lipoprotein